jgi:hypothetical protein
MTNEEMLNSVYKTAKVFHNSCENKDCGHEPCIASRKIVATRIINWVTARAQETFIDNNSARPAEEGIAQFKENKEWIESVMSPIINYASKKH